MPQPLSGPGVGLPLPTALYPTLYGANPYTAPTNLFSLAAGEAQLVPAGNWYATGGVSSAPQYLDPVSQQWRSLFAIGTAWGMLLRSDGFTLRIANLTDTAFATTLLNGGIVTGAGSGYTQATATVTAGTGNSTWQPVIGGALGTFTVVSGGSGYTVPPTVFIPYPPYPGTAATATATISANAVNAITIRQAGSGYLTAPPVLIIPSMLEPTTSNIVNATATVALTGAGTLTAVLLINFGTPLTTAPTLTVGGGSSGTATTQPATVTAAANDVIGLQPAP